jgi:hypothetical protein
MGIAACVCCLLLKEDSRWFLPCNGARQLEYLDIHILLHGNRPALALTCRCPPWPCSAPSLPAVHAATCEALAVVLSAPEGMQQLRPTIAADTPEGERSSAASADDAEHPLPRTKPQLE